jgi:hypothetical protein
MEEKYKSLLESASEKEKVVERYEQWMQNFNLEKESYRQSKIENAELNKEVIYLQKKFLEIRWKTIK